MLEKTAIRVDETRKPFLIIIIICISLLLGGYFLYDYSFRQLKNESSAMLKQIADSKARQTEQWMRERTGDAIVYSQAPSLMQAILDYRGGKLTYTAASQVERSLTILKENYNYKEVHLISTDEKGIFSSAGTVFHRDSFLSKKIRLAISSKKIVLSDIYRCQADSLIQMDVIAPIMSAEGAVGALIILRIDPRQFLFPLIQTWPDRSKTMEAALFRREGDFMLALNDLRLRKNAALNLRVAISAQKTPASKSARGMRGIIEGDDYRGIPVLAYATEIRGSAWIMVAKVDRSEIFYDFYYRTVTIILIVLLLLAFITAVVLYYISNRRRLIFEKLFQAQEEFRISLYSIGDAVITTDSGGRIKYMNPVAEELTGWTESEANGEPADKIVHIINEETRQKAESPLYQVLRDNKEYEHANHTVLISKSGNEIVIADRCSPIRDDSGILIGAVLIFRDQTEARLSERILNLRIRLYEFESGHTLNELFTFALDEVTAFTKSPIGFFHLIMRDQKTLIFQAWSTNTLSEYCRSVVKGHYSIDEAGVWAEAVKEREPVIRNDYQSLSNKKDLPAGHPDLIRELVVPVLREGKVVAILGIGNKEAPYNERDIEITKYIGDLIWDIIERRKILEEISESQRKYSDLFHNMAEGVALHELIYDEAGEAVDYRVIDVNPSFVRHMGIPRNDAVGKISREAYKTDFIPYLEIFKNVVLSGKTIIFETFIEQHNSFYKISAFKLGEGKFATVFENISELKRTEKFEQESAKRWETTFNGMKDSVMLLTPDGVILQANEATGDFFSIPLEEIAGKNYNEVVYKTAEPIDGCPLVRMKNTLQREMIVLSMSGKWFEIVVHPVLDEWNNLNGAVHVVSDITGRMNSEKELKIKDFAIESSINALAISDLDGNLTYVNPSFLSLWGYTDSEDVIGKNVVSFWQTSGAAADVIEILKSHGTWTGELNGIRQDDTIFISEVSAGRVLDEAGNPIAILAAFNDVTQRKKAEAELYKLNRVNTVISRINEMIVRTTDTSILFEETCRIIIEQGKFVFAWIGLVNENETHVYPANYYGNEDGYLKIVKNIVISDTPEGRSPAGTAIREGRYFVCNDIAKDPVMKTWRDEALGRGYRSAMALSLKNGQRVVGALSIYSEEVDFFDEKEIKLLLEVSSDISFALESITKDALRQRAEETLKISEQNFREVYNSTNEAIFIQDPETGAIYDCNDQAIEMYGYGTKEEILKLNISDLSADSDLFVFDQKGAQERISRSISEGKYNFEWFARKKNGEHFWVEVSLRYTTITGKDRVLAVVRDISERKLAEKALVEQEEKFRTIFEQSSDGMLLMVDGVFTDCNKAACGILGYEKKEEFLLRHPYEISPEYQPDGESSLVKADGVIQRALEEGSTRLEWIHSKKNGTLVTVDVNVSVITVMGKKVLFIVWRDITQRKGAEIIHKVQNRLAEAIVGSVTLTQVCETVQQELGAIVDVRNFYIATLDENEKIFSSIIDSDEKDKIVQWEAEGSVSGLLLKTRKKLLLKRDDILKLIKSGEVKLIGTISETWFGVPIAAGNKVLGVLVMQSYDNQYAFDTLNIEIIEIIANHLGLYIQKKQSEETAYKLSRAVEQSPASVVITDINGTIEYVNKKFVDVSGLSYAEAIGNNPNVLKSGFHTKDFYREMWGTILSGQEWSGELQNKRRNGEIYWEKASISPLKDESGVISHFIAIKEDISERKRMTELVLKSEAQFRSIWESSIDGMRLIDENGIIVDVNDSLCSLFETVADELKGKPFDLITGQNTPGSLESFKRRFRDRSIQEHVEIDVNLVSGKKLSIELSNSFIEPEGQPPLLLSIVHDVTEKKKILSDLVVAKEKAEEMSKVKSSFFANMSHELRTPLIGILGYSEILELELEGSSELNRMASTINKGGTRLLETLNLILNLSKLEANKQEVNLMLCDLVSVVRGTYNLFTSAAKLKGLQIMFSPDKPEIYAFADPQLMNNVIANLINNALKFTEAGSIEVKVLSKKATAEIEITDTGIGIEESKLHVIWEEFRQVSEGLNRQFEGTGLGLTIVQKYVELMAGKIYVESKAGVGSTFRIVFARVEKNDDQ